MQYPVGRVALFDLILLEELLGSANIQVFNPDPERVIPCSQEYSCILAGLLLFKSGTLEFWILSGIHCACLSHTLHSHLLLLPLRPQLQVDNKKPHHRGGCPAGSDLWDTVGYCWILQDTVGYCRIL